MFRQALALACARPDYFEHRRKIGRGDRPGFWKSLLRLCFG